MKKFSKILSIALLLAMVLSLGIANVFAEESGTPAGGSEEGQTGTETVQTPTDSTPATNATITTKTEGHTYQVFQIFTGEPDTANENGLINLRYGQNAGTGKTVGAVVSQEDIETLSAIVATGINEKDVEEIAKLKTFVNIDGNPIATVTSAASATVPTGYYLIKDLDGSLKDAQGNPLNDAYTLYIMNVVQAGTTFEIKPKADIPTVEKKVKDVNDSTGTVSEWQDTADHDIGDSIDYKLTGTLPSNFADYAAFKTYTFTDTLSTGLTPPAANDVKITLNTETGTDLSALFDVAVNGQVITVSLKANTDLRNNTTYTFVASDKIVVTYQAVLNDKAVIGKEGNPNKVALEYSNNPNVGGEGTGKTPEDTVIVFTFQVDVDKIDNDYNTLKGAGFALLKQVSAVPTGTTSTTYSDDAIKSAEAGTYLTQTVDENTINWIVVKNWGVNAEGYNFEMKGIDDGVYRIVETVVPTGYNKAADIDFTVTATHTNDPEALELKTLTVDNGAFKSTLDEGTLTFQKDDTHKHDMTAVSGEVATAVINNSGATLPSTGGVGTTIFYIVGAVLVVAAGVLLVTKKRMSGEE